MPHLGKDDAESLIKRRSPEWSEHQKRWRMLADSYEGGNRYRFANYLIDPLSVEMQRMWYTFGWDVQTAAPYTISAGLFHDGNLVPHLSEMSVEGKDLFAQRLERTPVPSDLKRVIHRHLSRIFSREVQRQTTDKRLEAWRADVDGRRNSIDKWIRKTVGPLLLVLGQLDLVFDHPSPPDGASVRTQADVRRFGLDRCLASYLLPENVVWWELERSSGRYEEVLIYERHTDRTGKIHAVWRHWTSESSNAYDGRGEWLPEHSYDHRFGCVPVIRVFDERKHRWENVGQSRYEAIAELQKAIFNLHSEQTLSDIQQSHALLQGPPQYVQADADVPVGAGNILPMYYDQGRGAFQGWTYLDPPKGAQAELRQHIQDLRDLVDREAALVKPAGASTRGTTAQSGVSKQVDLQEGNDLLSEVAETLADMERAILPIVLAVLYDGKAPEGAAEAASITYPKEFGLMSASDVADRAGEFNQMAEAAGVTPETDKEYLKRHIQMSFTGLTDDRLSELHDEVDKHVEAKAQQRQEMAEGMRALREKHDQEQDEGGDYGAGTGIGLLAGPTGSAMQMLGTAPEPS